MITELSNAPVLIISPAAVGPQMVGPAIRCWELARVLSADGLPVTLAVPNRVDEQWAGAMDSHKYLVVDLYDPLGLKALACAAEMADVQRAVLALNQQARLGDFFICASERQRDYWLGRLEACGRLNPLTYAADPTARRLIDVVPFGLPAEPPVHRKRVLKGVHPRVGPHDRVILWNGGLWRWLDPLTPIRAMGRVLEQRPEAHLVFFRTGDRLGVGEAARSMEEEAIRLSRELGLYDEVVLFLPWVPRDDWPNYLLEADLAVSAHTDNLETRFSFRTRLLDCIWAGLPVVVTQGDVLADLVEREGLGYVVAPGDVEGMARAMLALLGEENARSARREAFRRVRERLAWERVAEPLRRYCAAPWPAADRESFSLASPPMEWKEGERLAPARSSLGGVATDLLRAEERAAYFENLAQGLMSGRVMRAMLGVQRWWARKRGER